jgi:hypothetical protein
MPTRPAWRVPAARRGEPARRAESPDYDTLVRVRDGLKRL